MQWSPAHSTTYYLILAFGLAALLVLAWRAASADSARSLALLGLRAAVLGVLLVILLDPVRVRETRRPPQRPGVVVLFDESRSMALERPLSRLDRARSLLAQAESRLAPDESPRIALLGFGRQLVAHEQAGELSAKDDESRLREALERLPAEWTDDLPRAVYVFSDGRSTETTGFEQVAKGYQGLGVPIHVVPVGEPGSVGDVAIQDVVVPREARSGTKLPVRVVLRSLGFADERAEIVIRSLSDPRKKPLASLPITLNDGETARDLVIEADQARGPLVVEVPPLERETIAENNRVPIQVKARDPKIRVIYMEGSASNEMRYVHDALAEDPNIECLNIGLDNQYNAAQRLQRLDNPRLGYPATREELFSYDVVICSDIARSAFTPEQLAWTVELVGQRGGGFAMVGGHTSFGSGNWDQTLWDGLIPVDMSGNRTRGTGYMDAGIRIAIPRAAEAHPIWHIVDDPARNREILNRMPPFSGSNLTDRLKPAATLLGYNAQPILGIRNMPVFACQSFGKGRTFSMSTDTTYAWGTAFEQSWGEGDNRYFRKFWRNVVQWLAENSTNASRRLQIETDKVLYRPGETIEIRARTFDEHLEPTTKYRLTARLEGIPETSTDAALNSAQPPHSTTLEPRAGEIGTSRGVLTAPTIASLATPAPGTPSASTARRVTLRVSVSDGKATVGQADLDVQILDDSPEFRDPRPDRPRLETLANTSGGRILNTANALADALAVRETSPGEVYVSRSPVWDHPALWLLLLGLLSTEWIVRRVKGLA
jgi:uncharacterized membrane protein